ncbi:NADH-quinone oxidoreductase subunit C [Euryarchaeota archaeon ex4484_178]|nr:MAG: NADH-quinone oxidoreductase subunit C [Euryarchaeota archaeon ex4484_178]
MRATEIFKEFGIEFEQLKVKGNTIPRYMARVESDNLEDMVKKFKENGFNHFVALTCVDWIKDGKFELIYHLLNYEAQEDVFLSIYLPRENPRYRTLRHLFPQIETYEREIHEMFGVYFEGNDRLGSFILEDWNDMPPMRKDFDTEKYAKEKYESVPLVEDGGEKE